MVIMGQVQGRQMIDICRDAIEADKMANTMDKGFGFRDRTFETGDHRSCAHGTALRWQSSTSSSGTSSQQDPAEDALRQNTGDMIKDTGRAEVGELQVGSVEYPYDTYDYGSVARRSRRCRRRGI